MRQLIRDHDLGGFVSRHAVLLGAIACALTLSGVVFQIVHQQGKDRQQDREAQARNALAIERGCTLLNNAVIRSSQAANGGPSTVLINEILRNAVQHDRSWVVVRFRRKVKESPTTVIPVINCHKVARHPESIKALPLNPPSPLPLDYGGHG